MSDDQQTEQDDEPVEADDTGGEEPTESEEPTDNMGDEHENMPGENADMMGGDETEMMGGGGGFAGFAQKLLGKGTPEGVIGPTREEILNRLAEGTEMGPSEVESAIESGDLLYPSDAMMENVAGMTGKDVADLRKGNFGIDDGGDEEPEGDEPEVESATDDGDMPDGQLEDDDMRLEELAGDEPTESDEGSISDDVMRELEETKAKLTREECKRRGIENGERIRNLHEVRKASEKAYATALAEIERAQQAAAPASDGDEGDDEDPIDTVLGETGAASTNGKQVELMEQWREDGGKPGTGMIQFLEDNGIPNGQIREDAVDKVFPQQN